MKASQTQHLECRRQAEQDRRDGGCEHGDDDDTRVEPNFERDAAGAQRSPDGCFARAARGARQHQTGDVRAGNQQDESNRAEQDE